MRLVDITGVRFGKLTAISRTADGSNAWWLCVCECGAQKSVRLCHLKSGVIKTCGCGPKGRHRSQHGMTGTRVYRIWRQMHQRCENPKAEGYENYGGRGIKVDVRWNQFPAFFEDMGYPTSTAHTIDRLDVNKDYSKSNCKWSTWKEQHNNRRDNNRITAFGKNQTITQWAEEYKLPVSTLRNRLFRAKMKPETALGVGIYAQQKMLRPKKRKRLTLA